MKSENAKEACVTIVMILISAGLQFVLKFYEPYHAHFLQRRRRREQQQ